MSNSRLAVLVLCLVAAVSIIQAQDVFVSGGSSSTDAHVSALTAHPLTPIAGFQAGPGTFQVLSLPDGSKFYAIAHSTSQPVTITDNSFATPNSVGSFAQAPTGAVMSPSGTRLAVAAGTLHVFDTSTDNELVHGGISVGATATIVDLGISLDGKYYFTLATLAGGGSQLNSINTATNAISGTLAIQGTATGLAVGPNDLVYVATQNRVFEINPNTLAVTANGTIALNALPTKPVVTPDGKFVLVGNLTPVTGSSLVLISLGTHAVAATFPNVGFTFTNLQVIGFNQILASTNPPQGYYLINPNNGGPLGVNGFNLPGLSGSIAGVAVSDEVGAGARNTAETLFVAENGTIYSYDVPTNTVTGQQTLTDPNIGGGVSFAGAASSGNQPSSLLAYGSNQTVVPGATSQPLVAQALDATGRPVYGATITFSPNSGAVSVSPASVVTGANGYAVTLLTASGATGTVTVGATSGTAQASFTINIGSTTGGGGSTGDTIAIIGGQGQLVYSTSSTTQGGAPLTVQVNDANGVAVPAAPVTFAITLGGGEISPHAGYGPSSTAGKAPGTWIIKTDKNGQAAVDFTTPEVNLGTSYVAQNIVATGPNAATATFYETTVATNLVPSAYLLKPNQGAILTGQAGTTLKGAAQIQVVSGQDQLLPNVGVQLTNGGLDPAKFPSATCAAPSGVILTGTNGIATCDIVLGGVLGTGTFRLNIGYLLVSPTFQIKITAGPPGLVDIVAGNNQSGSPGQQLAQALVVLVTDSSGNILANTPVSWSVSPAGSVTLTSVSTSTDQNGHASALATLGTTAGTAQVTVTAGSASASFTLTVSVPEAGIQIVSGNGQSATVGTAFGSPLVVQVVDANNNPVPGAPVSFAVTGGTATLGGSSTTTGANGQASTTVSAGASAGTITVTATSGSFTTSFTLTATPVVPPGPKNITFTNGASYQPGIAPGGIALVTGQDIAANVQGLVTPFNILGPLPTTLAGVSITFNGTLAPIYYVSNTGSTQTVAVQVPFEVQPGAATVVVNTTPCPDGGTSCDITASATVTTQVQQVAPGVFFTGKNLAVVVRSDGSYVSPTNPAQRGEVVQLYVTGLGLVSPAAPTGATALPGEAVTAKLVVGLNNAGIPFQSAEYAGVGVYVITFQVPNSTTPGPNQPIGLIGYDDSKHGFFAQSTSMAIQ